MCASGRHRYAQAIADECRRELISQDDMANNSIEPPEPLRGETAFPDNSGYNRPEMMDTSGSGSDQRLPHHEPSVWSNCLWYLMELCHSPPRKVQEMKVKRLETIYYRRCTLSTAKVLAIVETGKRLETRLFDYKEFKGLHGAREAVDRFKPTWR